MCDIQAQGTSSSFFTSMDLKFIRIIILVSLEATNRQITFSLFSLIIQHLLQASKHTRKSGKLHGHSELSLCESRAVITFSIAVKVTYHSLTVWTIETTILGHHYKHHSYQIQPALKFTTNHKMIVSARVIVALHFQSHLVLIKIFASIFGYLKPCTGDDTIHSSQSWNRGPQKQQPCQHCTPQLLSHTPSFVLIYRIFSSPHSPR